jgi:ATP-dependent protease HslVU (ClpYQ) peptidase subunit
MTTVAWDGKTLAADRQGTIEDAKFSCTKIFRVRGHLIGFSGHMDAAIGMKKWFENGAKPADFPEYQKDPDGKISCSMLVITPDLKIYRYDNMPHTAEIESEIFAMGTGRDYALGAMLMGADAVHAVRVASMFDIGSGMGVDKLTFDDVL